MSNDNILSLLYAYYAVGAICATIWLALRVIGRIHIARHHPAYLQMCPSWKSIFLDCASQLLAWPLFTPNIVRQITSQLQKCTKEHDQ